MIRIGSTREDWPFQPWPARRGNALSRWTDDAPKTVTAPSGTAVRRWLLLALVPVLVIGLAGVAVANLLADEAGSESSTEDGLVDRACADQQLAALVREHHRAIRGL